MQSSSPVVPDINYFLSGKFFGDLAEATSVVKQSVIESAARVFYTRGERRIIAAQEKIRPELESNDWDSLKLAKTFKLPPVYSEMVRENGEDLTPEKFLQEYEVPKIPCVITALTKDWKAHENWSMQNLYKKYANAYFCCGKTPTGRSVYIRYKYFAEYSRENEDDSPLYIADSSFGERKETQEMLRDYVVPALFKDDLFNLLSAEEKHFPHRLITISPARSGINIRVNAFGSSMWSALIHGRVKWVLIHPDTPEEFVKIPKSQQGIHLGEAITWFSTVYKRIWQGDWPFAKYPVYECVQCPGETIFVPPGWWYANISEGYSIAISHIFCTPANLSTVYLEIRKRDPKLARTFLEKLNEQRPELLTTIYTSLRDSTSAGDECMFKNYDEDAWNDNDSCSYVTSGSDESTDEEESEDYKNEFGDAVDGEESDEQITSKEEAGDEESYEDEEDEESYEDEEDESYEDEEEEELALKKSRRKIFFDNGNKKEAKVVKETEAREESIISSSYDSESDSDDIDDEESEESDESVISEFPEIRDEPAKITPICEYSSKGGVKRRASKQDADS